MIRLVTIIFLFVSCNTVMASGPSLKTKVNKISPEFDRILTCGSWKFLNKSGFIRVITGWNGTHTEIYIQWIAVDKDGNKELVISTIFNKFGNRDFEKVQCDSGTTLPTITLLTEEIEFIGPQIVKVRPKNKPGKYGFSDYRNK